MQLTKKSTSWILALFISGLSFCANAQQTFIYKDQTLHFRQAKEYFDAKNYVAAREEFSAYLGSIEPMSNEQSGQKVLAEYYMPMCA